MFYMKTVINITIILNPLNLAQIRLKSDSEIPLSKCRAQVMLEVWSF